MRVILCKQCASRLCSIATCRFFREDKKRIHVTKEVYAMLSQTAAELNRAQKDFGKGRLVDRWASSSVDLSCLILPCVLLFTTSGRQ